MSLQYLQIAEAVAREKNIEKEEIIDVMEQAIQMAGRRKFGMDLDVKATLDRVTGDVTLKKLIKVVPIIMEPLSIEEIRLANREGRDPEMRPSCDKRGYPLKQNANQILLEEAKKVNADIEMGEYLMEDLPEFDFGRVAAQAAKQVIIQKVKDVERARELEQYADQTGTVISGIVKRVDNRGALIDLGGAEAFMPREETIQREMLKVNDRVRAYIYKVEESRRGAQIFLSRTHPQFLVELFKEEVPEVQNGTIEIMGAARDPGFRAKIAVKSYDNNLDPVGACVGIRGVRVQAVTTELQGERVDIINWTPDAATFLVKAMQPATVTKVVVDEDDNRIEVVVPEDNLSLAIGRRGQNVRLASMLTGWDIDVMTEAEEQERRSNEMAVLSKHLMENLDVDDVLAQLLIGEGFRSVDDLLKVSADELGMVEGLNSEIAEELQARAQDSLNAAAEKMEKLGIADDLKGLNGMNADLLVAVGEKDVKTLDDFADLATDELLEMLPEGILGPKQAERMIMAARQHWFEEEDEDEGEDDLPAARAKTAEMEAREEAALSA